ncbi:MAG: NUDIX hydrolase [Tepidiformaceae bacterium]
MTSHPHAFGRYCMQCGERLNSAVPEGDTRRRLVCIGCGFIHYVNPRPVAATIPERADGACLLGRRAIEPRFGSWVFPGGFMDMDETAEEAAARETKEEANLDVRDLRLLGVYTRPGPGVVVIVFEATAVGEASAGDETSEIAWFAPADIPWEELAFDSTEHALRDWVARRA